MEEKEFNKYLIILGSLILFIGIVWVGYNFLSFPSPQAQVGPIEPMTIQWNVFETSQLSELNQFSSTTFPTQTMGRDDPLSVAISLETE